MFLGHIVEVDPTAVGAGNDALGPEDHAETAGIQTLKSRFHFGGSKLLGSFHAPGGKNLVGMVVMMVMTAAAMFAMLMMMIVMMATAAVMFFMVMLVMVMVTTAMMFLMIMLVVVMMAAAMMLFMIMLVVIMVPTAMVFLMIMVMMLMIVMAAAAMAFLVIMVMMVVMMFLFQFCKGSSQRCLAFHGLQKLRTSQFVPGSNHQGGLRIVLSQERHGGVQFGLGNSIGAGQNDGGSGLDLIVVELAKILHIHLDLACIGDSHGVA